MDVVVGVVDVEVEVEVGVYELHASGVHQTFKYEVKSAFAVRVKVQYEYGFAADKELICALFVWSERLPHCCGHNQFENAP